MPNQIKTLIFNQEFKHSVDSFLKLLLKATKLQIASIVAFKGDEIIFQKSLGTKGKLLKNTKGIKPKQEGFFKLKLSDVEHNFYNKVNMIDPTIDSVEGMFCTSQDLSYCILFYCNLENDFKGELELAESQLKHLFNSQLFKKQSERLEEIINSTEVGTWEWNVQSGEVKINERYAEIIGYRKEELEPVSLDTWYQNVHPEDRGISDDLVQECFDRKRQFYNIECRLIHKDGSIVWVNDRGKVISWTEEGKPLIMAGTHTDITEGKLAEERLRNVINNVPGVVFRYQRFSDGSDRLLMVSDKAKELWGFTAGEVMENNHLIWDNYHPDDIEKHNESIEKSARDLSYWQDEWRYFNPDLKEYRWQRGIGNPLKQKDGSIVWDSLIRDVTDEIKTRNALEKSVRKLNERIKEQKCLTEISRLCGEIKDQKELISQAVEVLVKGLQFPDFALAEIKFKGKKYSSNSKKHFAHSISTEKKKTTGNVLQIQLGYWSEQLSDFLKEEKELLKRVTDMLVLAMERQAIARKEHKSKERYQSLVDTIDGVVWEADAQSFDFSYISPQVKDLLGYSQEVWLSQKDFWQNHIYEEDRENAVEFCHRKTKELQSHSFDYRMIKKDGSLIWIHDIVSVIEENGKAKLLRGILVDITENKAVENRLKSLYKDNRLILQSTEEGIYGVDNEGYCTFMNPAAAKILGYKVDDCIGKNIHQLVHYKTLEGKAIPEDDCPVYKAKEEKKTCRVEEDIFWKKNKKPIYVRYTSTPIVDGDKVNGAVVVFNDISEQVKTRDELAKNKRRYEALVENGGDAVAIINGDRNVKYVSPSIQNILGYSFSESLGLKLTDKMHPDDLDQFSKSFEKAIQNPGQVQRPNTLRAKHKDGHWVYIESVVTNMLQDPAVEGLVSNFRDVTPRVLAEQKIKASEKRFRALVHDGSDLITILNPDRSYQYVSPNYEVYTNLTEKELIGKKPIDFIHPDDQERVNKEFNQLEKNNQIKTAPFRFMFKDDWRWIQSNAINLINDEHIKGIVVNSADVTDLMETQAVLKESESRYRGFYESQTNYVIRTDMEGNYTYVNKKFLEDFAWIYPDGNVIGKNSMLSICEHHHQKVIEVVEACIQKPEQVLKVEIDKPKKDGGIITTLWDFVCILDGSGTPSEIQCVGIDISDRILFEKELKQNIQRFEHVNELTNDVIYDWDVKKDFILWGKSFSRIFGHSMEVIGRTIDQWAQLIHPKDIHLVDKSLNHLLDNEKENFWEFEYRFLKADGTYAWVLDKGLVERNEKGEPLRMVGILRDITKQKNEELQSTLERKLAAFFRKKDSLKQSLINSIKYLSIFGQFEAAEVWLLGEEQKHLNQLTIYAKSKDGKSFFQNTKSVERFKKGVGIPGAVWQSEQMELWDDIGKDQSFIRHKAASENNLRSAIGIPLFHMDLFIGCLVFFGRENTQQYLDKVEPFLNLKNFLGAEIKRKQQEEELSLLFESSPDVMAIASPNNHFVKANPAFCELLDYTEEEITAKPFFRFLHPDDLNTTKTEYEETVRGKWKARNFVNRYRTKKGDYKWLSWSSSEPFGENGFVFAYARDITEVKALEELLSTASELARLGFWEVDLEKGLVYFSKVTREIHEFEDNSQPSLESAIDFYREDYKEKITQVVEKAINEGEEYDYEMPIITAKGNEVWVKAIGKVEQIDGKTIRLYGSLQDITDRKLQQDEIGYQNQMLSTLNLVISKLLSEDSWQNILEDVFNVIGPSVGVDRVYYFENHRGENDELLASQRFEWTKPNIEPQIDNPDLQNMSLDIFKDFTSDIYEVGFFQAIVSQMHDTPFKRELKSEGILAVLIIPIFMEGEFYGFIGFDDCTEENVWNEAEINFLRSVASNLSNAIRQRQYKLNLEKAYEERNHILESIGDAFFSVDKNWKVTYWNQKAEEVLQTPKDVIINKNLWNIFEEAVELKFYSAYHKAMTEKVIEHFEEYFPPLEKWFDVSAYPSNDGISVFFRDVTDSKKIQNEIRASNERFEKVAEATNDAIWDYDARREKSYWGKGFETLFGIKLNRLKPGFDQLVQLMHPEDQQRIQAEYDQFKKNKNENKWFAEFRLKKSDGDYAYVIDRGNYTRDKNGDILRGVGAMTDITYRKEYEDSLQQLNLELKERARELAISNADLEQFAFVASHDLQEPLRMVTSFLTQLEKKYSGQLDERAHKYIDFAVDGAKRMKQIILDILEYSRVGRNEEEKQLLDLTDVLEDVKKILKTSIEERNVVIHYDDLPKLYTSSGPLLQIMQNLINNAIKYTDAEQRPEIKISGEERKEDWLISVSDNGIGINSEYYKKIFMIFQRLHSKGTYEGSGMGLAIVKKNIDKLGGEIWVDSKVGKGSTFYFTIKK